MKLIRANVSGFGSWVDKSIEFTRSPVICIYGENETGKTTLQQFLLFMLFGLPPRLRSFYHPKTSGKMGGRLTIEDAEGNSFTIERHDHLQNGEAVCYTENGGEHGEAWLRKRIKGMTRTTYQSIFSFSAVDLAGIQTMKADELGEVLLGVGLTGANNLHALEKKLDNKIGDLFKRYGKNPEMNKQLATLDRIFSDLKKQEHEEAGYKEKTDAIAALSAEIESLQSAMKQEREEQLTLEKQLQVFPTLKAYRHIEKQLSGYPQNIIFPENGVDRLQQLKEKLLPLTSEQSVLTDNQKKYEEKLQTLNEQLYPEATYRQAKTHLEGKQTYLENKREMQKLKSMNNQLLEQIQARLEQLDVGIAANDLQGVTFPFHIEKTWNDLKNDNEKLGKEKEQLHEQEVLLKKQQAALQQQKQKIENCKLTSEQRNTLTEKIDTYERAYYIQDLQRKNNKQVAKWKRVKETEQKKLTFIFTGSVAGAIILAIFGTLTETPLLFGGTGLLLLAGLLQYLFGKRSLNTTEQILSSEVQEDSAAKVTIEERDEAESLLAQDRKRNRSLERIDEQIKSVRMEWLQWEEQKAAYEAKERRFQDQLNIQENDYPFLGQVKPAYWSELFHTLKQLVNLQREQEDNTERYKHLSQSVSGYENELHDFMASIDEQKTQLSVEKQIETIESLLADYRDTLSFISQYEKWLQENSEQQRILRQKMLVYENEIAALYKFAATENEEDFLKKAKKLARKEEIVRERDQLSYQLKAMLPERAYDDLMKRDIADEHVLKHEYDEAKANLKQLEEAAIEQQQQLADIRAELANLETSEKYSSNLHRFTMEQEQLKQMAEEWSVLKTAKEMLAETKRNYREKYLDKVISRTTVYFTALTDGRYTQIFAPAATKLFQVETADGVRYDAGELSQGTVDQLYVSLRLAISEVMSREHRLPFIIDDAFVHFDATRTKRIMDILANQTEKQQMIIFTCKKEVKEAAQTPAVIHLTPDKLQKQIR